MIACLVDNTYAHRGWEITNTNTYGGYVPKTYTRFGALHSCRSVRRRQRGNRRSRQSLVPVMTGAQKARSVMCTRPSWRNHALMVASPG